MTRAWPTVGELFEEQAARTPDLTAIRDGDRSLTYQQLNSLANVWARRLRARGVGPESTVGLLLDRSVETVVACLSVAKAGGAYAPLAPGGPPARLRAMLRDCRPVVVLSDAAHAAGTRGLVAEADLVEIEADAASEENGANLVPLATATSLAYVLFTSGSSGQPKGVCIENRSLTNYLEWARQEYGLTPGDTVPLLSPLAFDFTVTSVLLPLIAGGCVHVVRDHRELFEGDDGRQYAAVKLTPSHLGTVRGIGSTDRLSSLTSVLVLGGEALLAEALTRWRSAARPPAMVNEYGPTEATVGCCAYRFNIKELTGDLVPIGKPIANATIHLLDGNLRPVPDGTVGEVYIGGACVARGYLGRPGLTAQRFLPDPFATVPGGRLYRTGDAARRLPDGNLEFRGRIDEQLKVLGYRIEPGEVEACLLRHPDIGEAVVTGEPDHNGEQRLVAYLVPEAGRVVPPNHELRELLRQSVPDYMVPLSFVVLPALPLTGNGKIDRRALADSRRGTGVQPGPVRPGVDASRIAGMWAEELGIDEVGADDNFFRLGGASLAALRIAARIREELGVSIPNRALFEHPTPDGLAANLVGSPDGRRATPVRALGGEGPFPLSSAQQRLWFLAQLQPESTEYNVPIPLRLRGHLRVPEMVAALCDLVERHRVLRTVFPASDGRPVQTVLKDMRCPLDVVELPLGGADIEGRLASLCSTELSRPFRLDKEPPIRARLVRNGHNDHLLLLTLHHIATDARSRQILLRDLGALYSARSTGSAAGALVGAPGVEYTDYVASERQVANDPHFARRLDYWRTHLSESPVLDLAPGRPRRRPRSYQGGAESFALDLELSAAIRELARRLGVTTNIVTLSAYKLLLGHLARQHDVMVGSPVAARPAAELDNVVGCFLNMLVLRTDLSGDPSFSEVVRRVRATMSAALDNADIPFEMVIDSLGLARDTGRPPLFQVAFSHHVEDNSSLGSFEGLTVEQFSVVPETTRVDLTLAVAESERLSCVWEYSSELFEPGFVRRLQQYFTDILRSAVDEPDRGSRLIWTRAVTGRGARLLGRSQPANECCVHELIERQASRTPDRVAVTYAGQPLTFAQLVGRARRLSLTLRGLGVGPEVPVALYLERGHEMLISLLAVWQAGGAYVPLDPAHPVERMARVLTASRAQVIVTQRSLGGSLPDHDARLVYVDAGSASPGPGPAGSAHPDNLAYVMSTSGSTGVPKAVAVTHRGVVNLLTSFASLLRLGADDTFLAVTTLTFDISVLELLLPLMTGAHLVIADSASVTDPAALNALAETSRATVMQATPSMWRMLADLTGIPARLRVKLCGGEHLSPELVGALTAAGGHVWNVYGPTETTVWSSANKVAEPPSRPGIGNPIANTGIYLLDERLNPVPPGVVGEIYIGGEGVARGYVGVPGLTARAFLPDPFATVPGRRMYRTGDLGRLREDDTVEFLGRLDHQVKIRGHRVEADEVEATLVGHPDVRQAVVAVRRDAALAARSLVAYVVPSDPQTPPDIDRIRAHARRHLPEYMMPGAYVVVSSLPTNSSGKLDRDALPEPAAGHQVASDYQPPRDSEEEILAAIWADLLGVDGVGIADDFFELGGDSILAVQVVSQARNAGLWITPAQVIDLGTVAELADAARQPPPTLIAAGPMTGDVRPTPGLVPWHDPAVGFDVVRFDLDDGADVRAVRAVLTRLLDDHDLLRAEWRYRQGRPTLVVPDGTSRAFLQTAELPRCPCPRDLLAMVARLADTTGPVTRALLIRPAAGPGCLVLAVHRAVVDRMSWRVVAADLLAGIEATRRGEKPARRPRLTSFAQWYERLEDYAASAVLRRDTDWWLSARAQQPAGGPLAEADGGGAGTGAVARVSMVVDRAAVAELLNGEAERWYGATPRELLVTALMLALTGEGGTDLVWVTIEDERRETPFPEIDISGNVGRFGRTYPVPLRRAGTDLARCVAAVRRVLRLVSRHGVPFGVARGLSGDGDLRDRLASVPGADILFRYRDELGIAGAWPLGHTPPECADPQVATVVVEAELAGDGLHIDVTGRGGVGSQEIGGHFAANVRELVGHCRRGQAEGATAPGRFPVATLTQGELNLVARGRGIRDVYPLTPAQQGMLFHSLYSPGQGMYLSQASYQIDGGFQLAAFAEAMTAVARRHGVLRSQVRWYGLGEPHQVVLEKAPLPLRVLEGCRSEFELADLMDEDRRRDFELEQAPPYRMTIVRTGDSQHHLVWTNHHLALDGWSNSILFAECWDAYANLAAGLPPAAGPEPLPYREYVNWIRNQNEQASRDYWRYLLKDAVTSTPLTDVRGAASPGGTEQRQLDRALSAELSRRVRRFCASNRLTVAAVICGAWALTLAKVTNARDVMFGVVMSGRFAPLPGIEKMVGTFANTLPLRAEIPPYGDAVAFLRDVQSTLNEMGRRDYSSLVDVLRAAGRSAMSVPFDTTVGVHNFPFFAGKTYSGGPTIARSGGGFMRNDHACTVAVYPGEEIMLRIRVDPGKMTDSTAELVANCLVDAIAQLAADDLISR
jgi:amino acid adenylation domain-containing protein